MLIRINPDAKASFQMFYLESKRAEELINEIADICVKHASIFERKRIAAMIVPQDDLDFDISGMLKDILDIAKTSDEKNFLLYCAHDPIKKTMDRLGFTPGKKL